MRLPRVRSASLLLAGVAAVAMIGGCGSSGKPAASANPNGANGRTALTGYLTCLSQHGVTLPSRAAGPRPSFSPGARPSRSPGSGGFGGGGFGGGFGGGIFGDPNNPPAGVNAATWSAALTACKSLQPTGRTGSPGNSAFTAYLNCLSEHGVTPSGGPGGFNTADPKVAAAMKTCAPLRPTGRPSRAPTSNG